MIYYNFLNTLILKVKLTLTELKSRSYTHRVSMHMEASALAAKK